MRRVRCEIDHAGFDAAVLRAEMPAGMRSTVLLFAPLLWRMKKIVIPATAKGCSLGVRELDPHLEILQALGAEGARDGGVDADARRRASAPPGAGRITCP